MKHSRLILSLITAAGFITVLTNVAPPAVAALSIVRGPVEARHAAPPPEDIPTDWWTTAQEDIRRSEYYVTWQDHTYLPDVSAAYHAPNRANDLRTYFTSEGPVVIPHVWPEGAEIPTWNWGAAVGRLGARG